MFVIYILVLVAMIFGVTILLKPQKTTSAKEQAKSSKNIPNMANSNDGGNSQRAEITNEAGSPGSPDEGMNSMGADNDDDKFNLSKTSSNLKKDFDNYNNS